MLWMFVLGALSVTTTDRRNAETYATLAELSSRYCSDPYDSSVRASTWNGKRLEDHNVVVDAREAPPECEDGEVSIHSLQVWYEKLAFAALRHRDGTGRFLTFFKTEAGWRVATSVHVDVGRLEERFNPTTDERVVLSVLQVYYESVDSGHAEELRRALHTSWHMKNLEEGDVYSESLDAFVRRVDEHGPYPGYASDRQIVDVQIVGRRFAVVVVDKPSSETAVAFSFYRVGDRWWIVDKAWAARE